MLNNFFREGGSEVNPAQNIITSHTLLKSLIIELSQEFCHKILFQSGTFLDLKNTVSLQAANIANFTDNIVFSCSVKKSNHSKQLGFSFRGVFESQAAVEEFRTHLFMSICVTGMKTVVTSILGWHTQKCHSPPSTGSVKPKSASFICMS